jgi:hypothetical protein
MYDNYSFRRGTKSMAQEKLLKKNKKTSLMGDLFVATAGQRIRVGIALR